MKHSYRVREQSGFSISLIAWLKHVGRSSEYDTIKHRLQRRYGNYAQREIVLTTKSKLLMKNCDDEVRLPPPKRIPFKYLLKIAGVDDSVLKLFIEAMVSKLAVEGACHVPGFGRFKIITIPFRGIKTFNEITVEFSLHSAVEQKIRGKYCGQFNGDSVEGRS